METMAALLIFVILSAVVTAGIPIAFRTYQQVVNGSNAELALATTTAALRDELGMAVDAKQVKDAEDKDVVYYQSANGQWHQIVTARDDDGAYLQVIPYKAMAVFDSSKLEELKGPSDPENPDGKSLRTPLIPDSVRKAKANGTNDYIEITMDDISYNDDVFTVKNLQARIGNWSQEAGPLGPDGNEYKVRRVL